MFKFLFSKKQPTISPNKYSTKTVYQLDDDGYYVGETEADESPFEKGTFPLPRNCVGIPPPPELENNTRIFRNGEWFYEPISNPPPPDKIQDLLHKKENILRMWNQAIYIDQPKCIRKLLLGDESYRPKLEILDGFIEHCEKVLVEIDDEINSPI